MTITLMLALFASAFWQLVGIPNIPPHDVGSIVLDSLLICCILLFALEMLAQTIANYEEYFLSVFFWFDVVGTASVFLELTPVEQRMTSFGETDLSVVRAARAAKLGARGVRFMKTVKILVAIALGDGMSAQPNQSGQHEEIQLVSKRLMSAISTRVSIVVLVMFLAIPLFGEDMYSQSDRGSSEPWALRLEVDYKRTVDAVLRRYKAGGNCENTAAATQLGIENYFEETVKHLCEFYESRSHKMHPFELEGFPERLSIDGHSLVIHGTSRELRRAPLRRDYQMAVGVPSCMVKRPGCREGKRAAIRYDVSDVSRLMAGLNISIIIFTLLILIVMSFSLNKSLEVMLTIENLAGVSKLMLKTNVVDDSEIEFMTQEERGIIDMMALKTPGRRKTVSPEKLSALGTPQEINVAWVLDFRFDPGDVESWFFNVMAMNEADQHKVVLHVVFDTETGHTSRNICGIELFQRFQMKVRGDYTALPYHNYTHSCDVVHAVFMQICDTKAVKWTSGVDLFALIVAAMCHDVGHFGQRIPSLSKLITRWHLDITINRH
jgi:hypothetical protein